MDSRSDRELLSASREHGSGFGEFYRRHCAAIVAFHGSRVREPELAADLTAETFVAALRVVQDRARLLPDHPLAWLFAIAHSKCVDSYRRGQVEARAREALELERIELDDHDVGRVADVIAATDFVEHLARLLPPEQFQALNARFVEDRRYLDIAQELDCSPAVVRMRVSRALKTVRSAGFGGS